MDLAGQVAVVTGGESGIGRACATALAERGARVALTYFADADAGAATIAAVKRAEGEALALQCDVSDEGQVRDLMATVAGELGGLDVLVNNAGIAGPTGPLETLGAAAWKATFDVNIHGQFYCIKHALPLLRKSSGASIVNLSSAAGRLGMAGRSAYSASKWAVVALTKTLAIELGPFGVTVNAVAPGFIATDMTAATAARMGISFEDFQAAVAKEIPVRRIGRPEDIAAVVSFLVRDEASFVSGQVVYVAGGPKD